MTIHRDWVGIMKEECPEAFTQHAPFAGKVGFIDGMPLLMKPASMTRWEELIRNVFVSAVQRLFRAGCHCVVLAFDVYSLVPGAKSITQDNRSKKVAHVDFSDVSQLPAAIPFNYNDCIRNRCFKRKVIQFVAESLPRLLRLEGQQSFVLDYEHCPVRFSLAPGSSDIVEEFMTGIPPMGESDVKCTRWFHLYGDGIAHSVDGDFLAILLLDHERCLRDREDCPRTCVYRMEFHGNEAAAPGPGSKRTRDGKTCRKRTMEFVHIPLLYESLKAAFRQCAGTGRLRNSHEPHYMEMLSCLIGLTGTDFSRNLPLLGVRKIWDMLSDKDVWPGVLHAFNVGSRSLDVEDCCNRLIARMYYEAYRKHISGVEVSLASVLHAISHAPKLSERTKKLMPAHGRVSTTVRNVNWLLLYWRCAQAPRDGATGDWLHEEACPDPVCEDYGFKAAPSRKNAVAWLDS